MKYRTADLTAVLDKYAGLLPTEAMDELRVLAAASPVRPEPVALQSVELTRDTYGMCIVKVNGREAIRDNGDVISHYATPEWFADRRLDAIATAYGHLWHVNNEPYSGEHAAYEARKVLRDQLTNEQRGEAINRVKRELFAKGNEHG